MRTCSYLSRSKDPLEIELQCQKYCLMLLVHNIPHYLPLEGGDYNGPQYLFCIDRTIDFESICEKYNYRYYPAYKFEVEEEKYNSDYQIRFIILQQTGTHTD